MGKNYYNALFCDCLSITISAIYISSIFTNFELFNELWSVSLHGQYIVISAACCWLTVVSGLCFMNNSLYGGYSFKHLNWMFSLLFTLQNTHADGVYDQSMEVQGESRVISVTIFEFINNLVYFWLMVICMKGYFLPIFVKEFQYRCIREDVNTDVLNVGLEQVGKKRRWQVVYWFLAWLPEKAIQYLENLEKSDDELM